MAIPICRYYVLLRELPSRPAGNFSGLTAHDSPARRVYRRGPASVSMRHQEQGDVLS